MADSISRLHNAVLAARTADPAKSRTAKLLQAGRAKMAKKLAEEAVEIVIDALDDQPEAVVRESADLLYNLVVLWVHAGVTPDQVWAEMRRRERLFGIAEKLPKDPPKDLPKDLVRPEPRPESRAKSVAKVVALQPRRASKRR